MGAFVFQMISDFFADEGTGYGDPDAVFIDKYAVEIAVELGDAAFNV